MAKVTLEITHPSFDSYAKGDVVEFDEADVTDRVKQFTKPYIEKKVVKKSADKK